ncbi:NPCBM/NEW2 domain-containing protein [Micromonospora chaiyaphumensis]|uniref:NPCBM/NEW2 domain-containing protein n=1 Tax=Micromonospora chaiyaphumensis TaxID=307119 RepID=A0A1C4TZC5_9ACTN|nr:NPCBM/NEW2 domain-containing protein [Micromonospora chaiyaphumensis]SCE64793.1 NPCBM/NEW2 domain-containing protein [Micromonospora chaiyaphumensis]
MRTDVITTAPDEGRRARLLPQGVGVVADVAAVAALLAGGGRPIVLAASAGAVLAAGYLLVRRLGQPVDRTALVGLAVAVAGAAIFGYALKPAPDSPRAAAQDRPTAPDTSTTDAPPSRANGETWLFDLPPVEGGEGWRQRDATVSGQRYEQSLVASTCRATNDEAASFNLGKRFTRFRATVGVADTAPDDYRTEFTVQVDGETVFRRELGLADTAGVDVPVTGGLRLVLRVRSVGLTACDDAAVWAEPTLR